MTIFHVIKYYDKSYSVILNELELSFEESYKFWDIYYSYNHGMNIDEYMKNFLKEYDGPI